MQIVKTELDPEDLNIVLSESLMDRSGNWYDLTFEKALEEQCQGKPLLYCAYMVEDTQWGRRLHNFSGWTEDRVIFNVIGIGVPDTLLDSMPRNPPTIDRFTI